MNTASRLGWALSLALLTTTGTGTGTGARAAPHEFETPPLDVGPGLGGGALRGGEGLGDFLKPGLGVDSPESPAAPAVAPAAVSVPLEPRGEWRVGPVLSRDRAPLYCLAESPYEDGHHLLISRSPRNEINLAFRVDGARLTQGSAWDARILIDSTPPRERRAVAAAPDLLVVAQGQDEALFDALIHGEVLRLEGAEDGMAFRLKGTSKVLPALRKCAEDLRDGKTVSEQPPLGRVLPEEARLPPQLSRLLKAAGLRTIGVLTTAARPPAWKEAKFVWQQGSVTAGILEQTAQPDSTLPSLTDGLLVARRRFCTGGTWHVLSDQSESLPGLGLRQLTVDCGLQHLAFLFFLAPNQLFTAFIHEGTDGAAVVAAHEALTRVVREAAVKKP